MIVQQYIPELDFWFKTYVQEYSELDIFHINIPETFEELPFTTRGSFLELLFSPIFDHDEYHYHFYYASFGEFPTRIQDRIRNHFQLSYYLLSKEDAELDIFHINDYPNGVPLLDELFKYRKDLQVNLNSFTYDELETFEKLIYIYLEMKITNDVSRIEDILNFELSSDPLILFYTYYVLNEAHRQVRLSNPVLDRIEEVFKPMRKYFSINVSLANTKTILVSDTDLPQNADEIYVYHNGNLTPLDNFEIIMDGTSFVITWIDLEVKEGDTLVVDYMVPLAEKTSEDLRGGLSQTPVGEI